MTLTKANVTTISSSADMIKSFGKANIVLPNNTRLSIKDALYSPESRKKLFSYKDICANGYHIETTDEDIKEYFYITTRISGQKLVLEKLLVFFVWNLLYDHESIKSNIVIHQKCSYPKQFML